MDVEFDIEVLGGLEVTVVANVQGAEPDVGYGAAYVHDWCITAIAGVPKKQKHLGWLYAKLVESDVCEAILERLD